MNEATPAPEIKHAIPAPPKEMLEIIILQLRGALAGTPAPDYVLQTGMAFIEALEKWSQEG